MDDVKQRILDYIENGQNVLLHAPGGTGKTHLLREIAIELVAGGATVACTAPTGVAALNLSSRTGDVIINGSTIHSWAGIGLAGDTAEKLVEKVLRYPNSRKKWMFTKVLFIDEVSMLGGELLTKLTYIAKRVRRDTSPFGGIVVVVCGDFLQLPPVRAMWVFVTEEWSELGLKPIVLTEPQRYKDTKWFELLLRVRKAEHTAADIEFLKTRVTAYLKWRADLKKNGNVLAVKPTILDSKKDDVSIDNEIEMRKLKTEEVTFTADDIFTPYNARVKREYYYGLLDNTIVKDIVLKVGAQVMLRVNLDIAAGYVNGSRGVVTAIHPDGDGGGSVTVRWVSGETTDVNRYSWIIEDDDGKASRSQIPLILAWAITIHKSQGASLDYCICNLGPSVFSSGQAYVALSRVRSSEGLFLEEFYPKSIMVNKEALEYVNSIEEEYLSEGVDTSTGDEDLGEGYGTTTISTVEEVPVTRGTATTGTTDKVAKKKGMTTLVFYSMDGVECDRKVVGPG